jgi:multidrug resistance efflux pump
MKLTPTRKFLIATLPFTLIIGAIATAYILMYRHVQTLVAEISAADAKIASGRKQQQQIGSITTLLRNHKGDFDRIAALSISRANPAPFFKEFETLAAKAHITMAINLHDRAVSDTMAFQFTIEGREENVATMLALIEHAPYDITIDDISIRKSGSQAQLGHDIVQDSRPAAQPSTIYLLINTHVRASP